MQKKLSENPNFNRKDITIFANDPISISRSDFTTAVRLTLSSTNINFKTSERSLKNNRKFSKQIIFASVLGALKGFEERDLKPFHVNHKPIFAEIGSEILNTEFNSISNEDKIEILKNAFDYGIRKVYHLEWKLYTSKELY
ncbi:LIC_11502 family protein [Leptospira kirschneri]|uniref:Uncharacterized protein n=1 Tax=Leptospira kirschneri str. 200802841 TaxID=1193047 RepID=A0A828Y4B8_9LEPT|nr:hypothetical protein [Leptospira kirschneri]EJO70415.1 hypothetical protein LEP1GSC044_2016 [Leptospira kirschneri serovar Grippotyphosa str. RM52]EKO51180.1 hypothetical protein LEP1GSC131_2942 [Leptospira kirschneri str. 200802841]EKP05118.1 hypothetical protein LEP1GSC018_2779 [Leptospira kirschneri str. 2008720114]EKQ82042.1 hypothetical protein LEP1GSC064_3969 [Leptospira kirschneri serovar Grippotyphosa str. Moskva]EKR07000.1 hypothetical protein LEP1GSC122_3496 [Leptospira kirschneri